MFRSYNAYPGYAVVTENSWTYSDLTAYIDALPTGMSWLYVTGPSMKTYTKGLCESWGTCLIFKRSDVLTNCLLIPSDTQYIFGFRRTQSLDYWEDVRIINGGDTEAGAINVIASWSEGDWHDLLMSAPVGRVTTYQTNIGVRDALNLPTTASRYTITVTKGTAGFGTALLTPLDGEASPMYRAYTASTPPSWIGWIEV